MVGRGFFIVFEGIDGSGKTTHIDRLIMRLWERKLDVLRTHEPTDGRIGRLIREYAQGGRRLISPETEALLFAADRREHCRRIEEALSVGKVVVSDRFLHSSLAYQGAAGADVGWIRELNRSALKPDLSILLDIDPEASLSRVKGRRRTIFEERDYLRRVRELYLGFVEGGELMRVDADRAFDEVQKDIMRLVADLLGITL
jgi:dTMP kinase